MRFAVLNDIHGNLPALEAVLDDAFREEVDRIVCCIHRRPRTC
jgi:predicted phosphodiesterase